MFLTFYNKRYYQQEINILPKHAIFNNQKNSQMDVSKFLVEPGKFRSLKEYKTNNTSGVSGKSEANDWMNNYMLEMRELQDKLYADNSHAVLLIFQAMDGAGKDSTIKHVMSGINPQG